MDVKTDERFNPTQQSTTTCMICSEQHAEGIRIWNHFICRSCEGEMVNTDVHDQKYDYFIDKLRRAWVKERA